MADPTPLEGVAASLRRAFDESFVAPAATTDGEAVEMLVVRLAAERWLVRFDDISGLYADRAITAVPGAPGDLMGIAGLGGAIVAVYDLGAVLAGVRASTRVAAPRWLMMVTGAALGLAVDMVEGHRRVPAATVLPRASTAADYVGGYVQSDGGMSPVLSVRSVLEAITRRVDAATRKERS